LHFPAPYQKNQKNRSPKIPYMLINDQMRSIYGGFRIFRRMTTYSKNAHATAGLILTDDFLTAQNRLSTGSTNGTIGRTVRSIQSRKPAYTYPEITTTKFASWK
jgi:hypothetical protein